MRLFILIFLCFHFGIVLSAQNIEGVVRSGNEPVIGANVVLIGTGFGDATDMNGTFQLKNIPAGTYQLRVSAVGYQSQSKQISVQGNLSINFELQEEILQSDEVVITASRREETAIEAPISISVIGTREIENRNQLVLDDALRTVSGVQMVDNQVNIRGSSGFAYGVGSRIQFLLDGVPMLQPDAGNIPFDILPTSQIKQVEVVKGPGSALYGGGALGGVINIITKDLPEKQSLSIRSSLGTYQPVRYSVWRYIDPASRFATFDPSQWHLFGGVGLTYANRPSEKFGYWVNAEYRGDEGYAANQNGKRGFGSAKLSYRIKSGLQLDILGTASATRTRSLLFWQSAREALIPAYDARRNGTSNTLSQKATFMPILTHLVSPRFFYAIKSRLYYVKLNPIRGGDFGTPESAPDSIATRAARYGIEAQFNYNLLNNRYLVFGTSYDANFVNNKRFFGDNRDYEQPELGIYTQYEQKFFEKLKAVVGLRLDSYSLQNKTVARLSPKLNLSYEMHPLLAFRAAYGQGFRVPGVTERYVQNQEFLPLAPNPDLAPEYATGYEVGARGFFPIAQNWGGQFDVSFFRNDLNNLVEPQFNATLSPPSFQFVNITQGKIQGVETMLGIGDKKGRYLLNLGYTYLDAQDVLQNKPLNFRSKHLLQANTTLKPFGYWEFGVDARYASAFENVDLAFAAFVDDADLTVPTKVVDVRIGTMWKGLKATLLVKNAAEYYYMERPAILAPPRHFVLRLQRDF